MIYLATGKQNKLTKKLNTLREVLVKKGIINYELSKTTSVQPPRVTTPNNGSSK